MVPIENKPGQNSQRIAMPELIPIDAQKFVLTVPPGQMHSTELAGLLQTLVQEMLPTDGRAVEIIVNEKWTFQIEQ